MLFKWLIKLRQLVWRPGKFVYVAIGDSTVEGVGASDPSRSCPALVFEKIKNERKRAYFYNLGKSGARIKDVVELQLAKAVELKPDLITISVGANDLRHRTKLRHFEKDFLELIKTLSGKTKAKIIISNIPDVSVVPSIPILVKHLLRFATGRFNRIIKEHAEQFRCILVDLYTGSKIYGRKSTGLISEDGLHPSDRGYALWANAIIGHL